ncbi:hypothetical protein ACLOJK_011227, partial [Asimina triloba]
RSTCPRTTFNLRNRRPMVWTALLRMQPSKRKVAESPIVHRLRLNDRFGCTSQDRKMQSELPLKKLRALFSIPSMESQLACSANLASRIRYFFTPGFSLKCMHASPSLSLLEDVSIPPQFLFQGLRKHLFLIRLCQN